MVADRNVMTSVPNLWLLRNDTNVSYAYGKLLIRDSTLGVSNVSELKRTEHELKLKMNVEVCGDTPLPNDFPAPRLAMPYGKFAPDYLISSGYHFCSRRFRDALAQPDYVVQWAPVELIAGGAAARDQDYRLMRVLPRQPAMDLERSDLTMEHATNALTGEPMSYPTFIVHLVLLSGLQPKTEIFRMHESTTYIFVADSVALRVLRAGCTGMRFADPDSLLHGKRIERCRSADGIIERKIGFHADS